MGKAMKTKTLPEELIVEILVKLPVKSLLRFRCVCKSWGYLIKSPNFINMHLKSHSTKNDCILVRRGLNDRIASLLSFHSYESLRVISPHWQIPHFRTDIIEICGPCNGLLCISDGINFVLCNPAMREFKVIPLVPFPCPEGCRSFMEAVGFGFDPITNDYKVARIVRIVRLSPSNGYNYIHKVEIYNLSTNSWREIVPNIDMPLIDKALRNGTLFNGALHWIGESKGIPCILSFSLSTEVFWYMELPNIDPQEEKSKHLVVLNESLALWAYTDPSRRRKQQFVDLWVMRQYDVVKSWTKQSILGPVRGLWRPFLLWKNEAILVENVYQQLVSCALHTPQLNFFNSRGEVPNIFGVMVYRESLISIK